MTRKEKELEEYQKAREELQKAILEFLEKNSEKKYNLEEISKAIEIPVYWRDFDQPQREVIVSRELSYLNKLRKVEEIEEVQEFKSVYYYRIQGYFL